MTSVSDWLRQLGLEQYEDAFARHDIDASLLSLLDHETLRELGVASLGHRLRLLQAIDSDQTKSVSNAETPTSTPSRAVHDVTERRRLTVMFCDLVGSTSLADRVDPEEYHEVIERYRRTVVTPVRIYNGFVAEYHGDGILVYFGYPEARENDAAHALEAALKIVEAVRNLGIELEVRIGIATGLVVAGQTAMDESEARHEVLGSTTNLAARLQSVAEPGNILVGELTRRLTQTKFLFRSLGTQALRGLPEPVEVFQLEKASELSNRYHEPEVQTLPLFGRDTVIRELVKSWETAQRGRGQVVLLEGEPGIGKTRLVQELYSHIPSTKRNTLRFFGSPLHTNSAFYPIIEHVQNLARLSRTVSLAVNDESFGDSLSDTIEDVDQAARFIQLLLAAPVWSNDAPPESLNEQRESWIQSLAEQVKTLAEKRPVLLVAEDVHWMDPTTVKVLSEVVRITEHLPVLIVATHRAEFTHSWSRYGYVRTRSLHRLDDDQSRNMVSHLASNQVVDNRIVKAVIDKSDGVPLFIEELTKWLIEPGESSNDASDSHDVAIPETLQESLMARLDRLGFAKETAQLASVIGRQFSEDLLGSISDASIDAIKLSIDSLITAGLVEPVVSVDNAIFRFRHALIQEAAYSSLLISRRQTAHLAIAGHLERSDQGMPATEPAVLAHHFALGGDPIRAIEYRISASRQTQRQLALMESIDHIEIALSLLADLPEDEARDRLEIDLRMRLGRCLIPIKGYGAKAVWNTYERARLLAEKIQDKSNLSDILFGLATSQHHQARLKEAYENAQQIVQVIGPCGDDISRMKACVFQGMLLMHFAQIDDSRAQFDEGFEISERLSHPRMHGMQQHGVVALAYGSLADWLAGYPELAHAKSERSIALANELDSPYSLVYAMFCSLCLQQADGPTSVYLDRANKALGIAREGKFSFWQSLIAYFRDWFLGVVEKDEDSVARMVLTQRRWLEMSMNFSQPHYHFTLADAQAAVGQYDQAQATLKRALELCACSHDRVFLPEIHRLSGDVLCARGQTSAALSQYEQSAAVAGQFGQRIWRSRALERIASLTPTLEQ